MYFKNQPYTTYNTRYNNRDISCIKCSVRLLFKIHLKTDNTTGICHLKIIAAS